MQKGLIKQYIIPTDIENNNYKISFNELPAHLGYQIGVSIEEKAFMKIANPESGNVKMTMLFTNQTNPVNNIIEIGKTYIYEPGDTVNLDSISFDSNQWNKVTGDGYKGYVEVIVTDYCSKTENDYFEKREEEE